MIWYICTHCRHSVQEILHNACPHCGHSTFVGGADPYSIRDGMDPKPPISALGSRMDLADCLAKEIHGEDPDAVRQTRHVIAMTLGQMFETWPPAAAPVTWKDLDRAGWLLVDVLTLGWRLYKHLSPITVLSVSLGFVDEGRERAQQIAVDVVNSLRSVTT